MKLTVIYVYKHPIDFRATTNETTLIKFSKIKMNLAKNQNGFTVTANNLLCNIHKLALI